MTSRPRSTLRPLYRKQGRRLLWRALAYSPSPLLRCRNQLLPLTIDNLRGRDILATLRNKSSLAQMIGVQIFDLDQRTDYCCAVRRKQVLSRISDGLGQVVTK